MKVLVTGATGFVGRRLINRWGGRHAIVALVRRRETADADLSGCQVVVADLAEPLVPSKRGLPEDVEAIVHLAQARVPFPDKAREFFAASTASTLDLLEYGRLVGIKVFIYASSGSVYGFGPRPFAEDGPVKPKGFYAVNKMCAELLVGSYECFFSTHVLRLFFPYGPGQRRRRVAMIAERVVRGEPVDVVNGGQPRINPIYVDDLVRIIEHALTVPGSHTVNVAGDEIVSMVELAELVGQVAGRPPSFRYGTDPRVSDLVADNRLMHALYGLSSGDLTPLREGLSRVVADLRLAGKD